ncbi:hypothetical protein [Aureivirga marina]|uniref:hypothetical protein n=1 Tax=Aureivirga marina TaxID=1182451 RepID=UPI0018CA3909|nr:hypothetical protein [Aureivirga marina]
MKKLVLSLAIVGTLFSCSKDDDGSSTPTQNSVIGTYKLTSATTQNPVDFNEDGDFTTDLMAECGSLSATISFSENNMAIAAYDDPYFNEECLLRVINGEYTIAGNGVAFTGIIDRSGSIGEAPVHGNYVIKGNTLEFTKKIGGFGDDSDLEIVTYIFTKQ